MSNFGDIVKGEGKHHFSLEKEHKRSGWMTSPQTLLCCSIQRSTSTLFFLSTFCLVLSYDLSQFEIFIYIYIDFMFCSLHCELWGCWFPGGFVLHVSPAPHSPGNIVSTQNPTVRIIFIEHLLGAVCSSKLFTFIISFNPHRVSLLTLDSEDVTIYAL